MIKRSVFAIAGLGSLLLFANSASADITSATSSVDISSSPTSSYKVKFSAKTLNNNANAKVYTLYKGVVLVDEVEDRVRTSGAYTSSHEPKIRYKVESEHTESLGAGPISDFKMSSDTAVYDPIDWTLVKEDPHEAKEYENLLVQSANEIADDTGIDLSEYTVVDKEVVFNLDKDLFKEVNAVTKISIGDIRPQIYLHESRESLYVLKQSADGESTVTEFVLENDKWEKQ
ncbi:hypothetical protein [Brevibacillus sp. 1238]|uniref:hypothetical protein n=1 Tax=Brevibacillus sp. 1238 TaxID=2940565 RepID=UPI0024746E06|nr:hypothetical protein [Brevibacillus sp. 1238]MDH6348501.1 hypothetical protein [Brevibacillus sp. 1238]